ncbi:MFS superfamily sulfate permease-like transporter [Sphingomonas kyeonggiensis]|uniref:SulP family inorganic anion transporter n=1 Tax=Sphingomonas kyeonggiensis TaxID=1268553 RepID=UPI00277E0920|nr:SulP family inorganic anion transporter [Sphingomonas kyeonggiensis]MDQ0251942.1 MFS superfamily sulfate permease-like transporter [Sphingomonas kyeonggiensis]
MTSALPKGWVVRDFTASIVVFLVAMPLCMGIAVASGMPPEKGLLTGIIGGVVVGLIAGSPLQVSGPAAGLAVIVFELVREHGLAALGAILVLAGALQVLAGVVKVGGWFRAISPAVVHGMLAGIGALIVVGQFHTLFDAKPLSSGLENLAALPSRLFGLEPTNIAGTELALALGVLTIVLMIGWDKLKPTALKLIPGALVGVVGATLVAFGFGLDVVRVAVPDSLASAVTLPGSDFLSSFLSPTIIIAAVAVAFIASAETLLSAAAVDRMHDGVRTDYNKELRAQGVGNLLCGIAGALPMTGVIVRSSANVQAGAITRMSAVLHGAWLLGFAALLPWLLREIPMAALGGVLVVTGWKLVSVSHVRHLFHHYGLLPAAIWAVTFVLVIATDLLTGVLVGLALSVLELLPHFRRLRLKVDAEHGEDAHRINLDGAATFVTLPKLNSALDAVPGDKPVHLDFEKVPAIDHTSAETLRDWVQRRRARGLKVELSGNPDQLRRLQPA